MPSALTCTDDGRGENGPAGNAANVLSSALCRNTDRASAFLFFDLTCVRPVSLHPFGLGLAWPALAFTVIATLQGMLLFLFSFFYIMATCFQFSGRRSYISIMYQPSILYWDRHPPGSNKASCILIVHPGSRRRTCLTTPSRRVFGSTMIVGLPSVPPSRYRSAGATTSSPPSHRSWAGPDLVPGRYRPTLCISDSPPPKRGLFCTSNSKSTSALSAPFSTRGLTAGASTGHGIAVRKR